MAYDSSGSDSKFRYRIAWDLDREGGTRFWSSTFDVPGVGNSGKGAGAAVVDLDGNKEPELVLMAYDAPSGTGRFNYRVGRDLNPLSGQASSWSEVHSVAGLAFHVIGAGVETVNLDNDPRPEMVLSSYHESTFNEAYRYTVGWNLNADGKATHWTAMPDFPTYPGGDAQGLGIAFGQIGPNPEPDLILLIGEDSGTNYFRYLIGRDIDAAGLPASWEGPFGLPGFLPGTDGNGAAFWDLDGDGDEEVLMMSYDRTSSGNTFRYLVRAP